MKACGLKQTGKLMMAPSLNVALSLFVSLSLSLSLTIRMQRTDTTCWRSIYVAHLPQAPNSNRN
jgi:hypothetical protein